MQLTSNNLLRVAIMTTLATPLSSIAGGVKFQDGDKYIKIGGRIQLQYHQEKPEAGDSTDEIFFRR